MNSLIKLQFNMKYKILTGILIALLSATRIIAQCGFLPTCSSTNYLHFGMGSTTNATSLEYDNFVSSYHSTVVRTSSGVYKVWGEDMGSNGVTDLLAPTIISSASYTALGSASVLKVGLGSSSGNTVQGVLLATNGLYAWSTENSVLHTNITSSAAFQKLTINGQSNGLPAGINPTDVKMMFATYHTLAIVTCSGAVYVITCGRAENTGTGITGAISAANAVQWFQVTEATAGNPNISNVIQIRGTENTLFALKSDGTLWTWGQETYLGNNTNQAAISRATLMTSPSANPIKMIGATSEGAVASYYVLNADGNLYGLGGNTLKQLGDWTTTDRLGWVQPKYSASGPVMNNIHWISPQEQTDQFANINVLTVDSTNYNWGHQDGAMLGRGVAGANGNYDPGIPGGLTVADKVLAVETGGHTSMLAKKCEDFFGYVGHRVRGSMGDGTTNTTNENVYTFATAIVYICGASTIDVAVSGTPTFGPTGLYCNGSSTNLLPSPSGGVLSISSGPATLAGTVITFTGTGTTTVNVQYLSPLPGCSVVKTATTTLLTENCPLPPVAVTNSLTTPQNTVATGNLATNDTGAGASYSPTITVTQPSSTTGTITVNSSTGGYTFTPNPSYVGSGTTTYTLCNNTGSCSSTTITYTVTGTTPVAVTNSLTTLQNTVATGNLSTNDIGGGAINSPTFTVTQPSSTTGTITVNTSTGGYTFTPNPSYVGSGSTTYTLCNNTGSCSSTTITYTVTGTAPIAVTNSLTTLQNTVTTGDLSTNDTGGGAINSPTFTVTQPSPTTGTITVNASTGGYTFTPNPSYVGSGSTTYTLCNNTGSCSSTTITYTVNSIPSLTISASSSSLCIGSSSSLTVTGANTYTWNPGNSNGSSLVVTPSVTTIYTVTGANAAGITNTQTVSVTVNSLPTLTATASSSSLCVGSSSSLTSTGANTYTWNPGNSSGSSIIVTPTVTTIYTVTGTNAAGCTNTQTVSLTVNTLPTAGITNSTGTTTLNCTTTAINVTATGGTSYVWTGGLGSSSTATITNPGTYTVTATAANGCSSQSVITVTQNTTAPVVSATTSTSSICIGDSVTLAGSGANTYTWNPGNLSGSTVTVSPISTLVYTVTGTNAIGCSNTETVTVTVNSLPVVSVVASSTAICDGFSTILTVGGASSYLWNTGATTSTISVNPSSSTVYSVTGTDALGCVNSGTVSLVVNALPTLSISSTSTAICSGSTSTLTVSGANTYLWNTGETASSISVSPILSTDYTVTGTSIAGCESSSTFHLDVTSTPTIVVSSTPVALCSSESGTLTAIGALTYTWNPVNLTGNQVVISQTATTVYSVTGANGNCASTSTISVALNNCPTAVNDATTTIENTPVSGDASTNDNGTVGGTFTSSQPSAGTGSITMNSATGQYTYTPDPGYVGTTSVTYTLCNGSPIVCSSAVITITVFPALVANPDVIATTPSVSTTGTLTTNDGGVITGGTYSVTVTQPSSTTGTITLDPATGGYTFTPNPSYTGSTTTTYTICNTSVDPIVCSTTTITIIVGNLPIAIADATTTIENTPVSGDANANDSGGIPSLNPVFTAGPVTAGTGTLTMDPAIGSYTFTPAPGFTGTTTATYTLCNVSSPPCSTTTITFTIFPTLVANPDDITTLFGVPTTGTLTTNDGGVITGGTYSVTVTQPSSTTGTITVDPATGSYTFTPTPGYTGTTTTTYTICNTSVNPIVCSTTTISITVGILPIAVADATTTIENTSVSGDANANDTGGIPSLNPVFTAGLVTAGTGTLTMDPATGSYTFTPAPGFTGTTTATYTLCNVSSPPCSTTTITFTVFPSLVANPDVIATTPSVSTTGTLTTNDGGVITGGTYSVTVTQPSSTTGTITVDPATGGYTFTPNPSYTGSTTTTYTICNTSVDPIVCSTTTITIIVGNLPIAVADATTTIENTPVSGDANANDTGGIPSLNPVFTAGPVTAGTGTLTMDPATGSYTFTPAPGFTGTTTATYTLCNVSSPPCSTTTITFTVFPTLVANPDVIATTPNVSTTGTVTTNDGGVITGGTYSVTVTQPSSTTGTITVDPATGSYTFTPTPGYNGTTTTTYTICNTSVNPIVCSTTTITIIVGAPQIAVAKTVLSSTKINATSFQTVFSFNVVNLGNTVGSNVQLVDNLNNTFPSPITYTVVGLSAGLPLTTSGSYNGNSNIAMLSGTNSLNPAQSSVVTLTVNFTPNTTTLTVLNNSGIGSTSNSPDLTGNGVHTSADTSATGTNPDPDGDGNPNEPGENTPTTLGPQVGASKSASSLTKVDANTYQTVFTFNVSNVGPVVASNIQLTDNLNTAFPSPITYTVVGLSASSPLTSNSGYNGNTNIALLSGVDALNVYQSAVVTLTVNFNMNNSNAGSLYNIGVASSSNLPDPNGNGTHTSSDTTGVGNNADPDGDGNPNEPGENTPTEFGQQIGVAKSVLSSVSLGNSVSQTTFMFTIQNLGVVPASNVQLVDNLNATFPSPITYTVSNLISGTSLITNASYNGNSITSMLSSGNTLAVGAFETVTLVVNYNMNGSGLTTLYNSGIATTSGIVGVLSSDTTNAGNNPDPNGNGVSNEPGENVPTGFNPVIDSIDTAFSIPQGFSPNGDGINDLFVIKGISSYPNNTLTILNRWGNVVYKMSRYDNTWNGKSTEGLRVGGDDLPEGTYFYILDLGIDEKPYKGYIYLNKTIK